MLSANKLFFNLMVMIVISCKLNAQPILTKVISITADSVYLSEALKQIGKQGGFHFSYNSNLVPVDSVVSLSVSNKTVKQTLDLLFAGRLQYKELSGYIILQRIHPSPNWYISGYVRDCDSGEKLCNVSIYERTHLVGTTTDENGYFKLQLKDKNKYPSVINISVSCISYEDTSFHVNNGYSQELALTISPSSGEMETVIVNPRVEGLGMVRWLISSRIKKQTGNLRNFLATKPIQFSLTPGISTHGRLGTQVVNKFSLNLIGGYTAGVDGVEIGSFFNIVQKDVNRVQVAGLFNVVGGSVHGAQIGGIHNQVLDSVKGGQVGGLVNLVGGNLSGSQVSGIYGRIGGNSKGAIIAGIASRISKDARGLQLSGIASVTRGEMNGTQIAGIYNYTRSLKGFQMGLINRADTIDGYSIGLININKNGYHHFTLHTSNVTDVSLSYKAGNQKLYCILTGSFNLARKKAFGVGYGVGNETILGKNISLLGELTTSLFYTGSWRRITTVNTLSPSIAWRVDKRIQLYTGPSLSVGWNEVDAGEDYAAIVPKRTAFSAGGARGWFGWQAGIMF